MSAAVSTSTSFPLNSGGDISLGGEVQSEVFNRYSGLNNQSLGATLGWQKKWGLGPFVPLTAAALSSTRLNFSNSIRNGWRHQLTLTARQRLSEHWKLGGDYVFERRAAHSLEQEVPGMSGDVFSQSSQSLKLNAEYAWSDTLLFDFGYLSRRGDVVATTQIHRGSTIFGSSKAIAEDPVFGSDFYAYRLTGTTQGLSLDACFVLSRKGLLTFGVQHMVTHGAGGNNYSKYVASINGRYDF
jgi:hypothetical protein